MSVYNYDVTSIYGEKISLSEYEGKVLLIVNTATECGFTPQYDDLQDLYEKYGEQGFEVLDFPCNQFGNQAPGSSEEIASFCDSKFGISFTQFAKVDVNGENATPLYKYLVSEKGFAGFDPAHPLTSILEAKFEKEVPGYQNTPDIKWNFTKFLVDRSGNVVERFEPTEDMGLVEEKVKDLL